MQMIGNLIRVMIPLVIYGLMAWILYKFYGGLMKIRDELRHINEALRERKPNL